MLEKLIILVITFSLTLGMDISKLLITNKREIIAYSIIMVFAIYLGLDYLLEIKLPHMDELLDGTLTKPAKRIAEYLQVHK